MTQKPATQAPQESAPSSAVPTKKIITRTHWVTMAAIAALAAYVLSSCSHDESASTTSGNDLCPPEYFVYLEPSATRVQIENVGAFLEDLPGTVEARYVDEQSTYRTFTEVFSDQPEMMDQVAPGDLPTSYEVRSELPPTATDLQSLETLPGVRTVMGVDERRWAPCGLAGADSDEGS